MARMTRASTVPSPTPASNTLTAGGRGWILASSMPTRCATTHFSLQVLTNSRYFWRLSKKRKFFSGFSVPAWAAAGVPAVVVGKFPFLTGRDGAVAAWEPAGALIVPVLAAKGIDGWARGRTKGLA